MSLYVKQISRELYLSFYPCRFWYKVDYKVVKMEYGGIWGKKEGGADYGGKDLVSKMLNYMEKAVEWGGDWARAVSK